MGIQGLEKLVYDLFKSVPRKHGFEYVKLKDLKLVIDGEQLAHAYFDYYKGGEYGGQYDEIYENMKSILQQLQTNIELVVFDGPKDHEREISKLKKNVAKFANLPSKAIDQYFKGTTPLDFQTRKPCLIKFIIQEILEELGIKYALSDDTDFEVYSFALAIYANGHNRERKKFTVLSKNTYFNLYKLDKGYLSWKSVLHKIMGKEFTQETTFPIFKTNLFCAQLQINWITFFYACILKGDNDKQFDTKIDYFKSSNLRPNDFTGLIEQLKNEEWMMMRTNFSSIRSLYSNDKQSELDKLIKVFNLQNVNNQPMMTVKTKSDTSVEFDRFAVNLKERRVNYFKTLVEDCSERSCFECAESFDIFKLAYLNYKEKSLDPEKFDVITEYFRTDRPTTAEDCVETRHVSLKNFRPQLNLVNRFLCVKKEQKDDDSNEKVILMCALSLWLHWLEDNSYNNDIGFNPMDFVEAVLVNFLMISFKEKDKFETCSSSMKRVIDCYVQDRHVDPTASSFDMESFMRKDLPIIHRLNELQAVYYALSILNDAGKLGYKFSSPRRFLNCRFVMKWIRKEASTAHEVAGFEMFSLRKASLLNEFKKFDKEIFACDANNNSKDLDFMKDFSKLNI
jgi:hypothetical protein